MNVTYQYQWAAAIAKNDWNALEKQIRSGLNVNRGPIIHTAIQQKRYRIAEKLIEHGADVNKVNRKGKSPLQILIENNKFNPPNVKHRRSSKREAYLKRKKEYAEKLKAQKAAEIESLKQTKDDIESEQKKHSIGACGDGAVAEEDATKALAKCSLEETEKDVSKIAEEVVEEPVKEMSVIKFARYLMEKGANKINGINDGPNHLRFQEFYKRKTKLTRHEYDDLQDLIRCGNTISLERKLNQAFTVHSVGPDERFRRGMLHMAVIAPCMEIVKVLLDRGADPNLEDANGCTPLSMIFFPIMFNERHRYRDESQIPRELLMWNDPTGLSGEKGRNDMLVCIGQRLLQAGARFVPDHTPDLDKKTLQEKWPNCPLIIFWHLYSKGSGTSMIPADPIIACTSRKKSYKKTKNVKSKHGRRVLYPIKEV